MEYNNCVRCNEELILEEGDDNMALEIEETRATCNDPNSRCGDCCNIFTDQTKRTRFGITLDQAFCHCRDICIQEVRAMCAQDIDFEVDIPTAPGAQSCRGEFNPTAPPFTNCEVLVTCAREELKPDCSGTNIWVGFQIILTCANVFPPTKLIINYTKPFYCTSFYAFPDGGSVNVPQLLKIIDGSQLVIQNLQCVILDAARPRVRITGKLIDKLWKEDNLWVQAIRPYSGITVKQEFAEPHKIGLCPL